MVLDSNSQAFHWCWPGRYQPLHAIMIIVREVGQNPQWASAVAYRAIVDDALALCSPNGGLTVMDSRGMVLRPLNNGGSEVWDFIKRLRARVWTRCGADPDILPSRQDVLGRANDRATKLNRVLANDGGSQEHQADKTTELNEQRMSSEAESELNHCQHTPSQDHIHFDTTTSSIYWQNWETEFSDQELGEFGFFEPQEE
jgi:hypothetical protein